MSTVRSTTAPTRPGRRSRRAVARMAPPAPRPRREPAPGELDDRSLFSSAHALECTADGYLWR
jgi:hypothetical protein